MKPVLVMLALALAPAQAKEDFIQSLVARLSESHTWLNGGYPVLKSPETAAPKEVIAEYCSLTSFGDGSKILEFTIDETRPVRIRGPLPDTYTAVLCKTDHGAKIFLLQYRKETKHWWVKLHDVPQGLER